MTEWKTDTEEVKQIVKKCRDFKGFLQEEKCAQFTRASKELVEGAWENVKKVLGFYTHKH
ncbi:hypothetical protein [Helicobacter pylori]|uniref:hypothetical protein n=1 Tax=Helicobacter pylori TaxID=210 RepID=UPI001E642B2B|nr:hypothetical protein [Helicobacter pylori]